MDYNPNQPLPYDPVKMSRSAFLSAAMLFALLSFTCGSCFLLGSMFFTAMSILFAVLSKGEELKMHIIGKAAIAISVFSLIFSTIITALSAYTIFSDPAQRQEFCEIYETLAGSSLEEDWDNFRNYFQ